MSRPEGQGTSSSSSPGVVGRPQARSLALPAGRYSAQYKIIAPDPAKYAFGVVVTAPVSVDVSVSIRTWYGAILPSILTSSHAPDYCTQNGSQDVCTEPFPLLPAQRPGEWTVVAAKRAGPAATVHIAITFTKP